MSVTPVRASIPVKDRRRRRPRHLPGEPMVAPGEKRCMTCREIFPKEYFSWKNKAKGHRQSHCPPCTKLQMISWAFDLSAEEYLGMIDAQGGRCAICLVEGGDTKATRLQVDHDHETGAVRGLLCPGCNKGIGFFQDNTDALKKAVVYLGGASFT